MLARLVLWGAYTTGNMMNGMMTATVFLDFWVLRLNWAMNVLFVFNWSPRTSPALSGQQQWWYPQHG